MVYWNSTYFKQLYEQYSSSDLSVRSFCQSQDIKENRFYYWIHKFKLNAVSSVEKPQEFIPLTSQDVSCLTGVRVKAREVTHLPVKSQRIKLVYPNGVVLQLDGVSDMAMLKQLVSLIS